MAALPVCDTISVPAVLNQYTWVVIVADRDYFLLEADIAPGPASGGNIAALIGKLPGPGSLPGVPSVAQGVPVSFSSTNTVFPKDFMELWVGSRAYSPPFVTLNGVINQEFKNLPGAIPLVRPPVIKRGEVLIVAVWNLTSSPVNALWNLSAVPATTYAQELGFGAVPETEGPQAVVQP